MISFSIGLQTQWNFLEKGSPGSYLPLATTDRQAQCALNLRIANLDAGQQPGLWSGQKDGPGNRILFPLNCDNTQKGTAFPWHQRARQVGCTEVEPMAGTRKNKLNWGNALRLVAVAGRTQLPAQIWPTMHYLLAGWSIFEDVNLFFTSRFLFIVGHSSPACLPLCHHLLLFILDMVNISKIIYMIYMYMTFYIYIYISTHHHPSPHVLYILYWSQAWPWTRSSPASVSYC